MNSLWARFSSQLTPGVRVLLLVLVLLAGATLIGDALHAYSLSTLLGLSASGFWKGKVWTLLTYFLVTASVTDLLFTSVTLFAFAPAIERAWSRTELWSYCLLCGVTAGLFRVCIAPVSSAVVTGFAPVFYGLLVAWALLLGRNNVSIGLPLGLSAGTAALLLGGISLLLALTGSGWLDALVSLSGGVVGWMYLTIRWKWNRSIRARPAPSDRIGRLEL